MVGRRRHLAGVGGAERGRSAAHGGMTDVGVLRGEGDREHHAVVVDPDVVEVGDVAVAGVGVGVAVPDHDLQLGVLAVCTGLALLVLVGEAEHVVVRELERVVGELDAVVVEEHAELGPLAGDADVNGCQCITPSSWLWTPVRTKSGYSGCPAEFVPSRLPASLYQVSQR